ncbi:hypothetical protein JQ604_12100 [Bradyrhizobium jicamae]|nr:hypothetical protein [Bradyrhizobium jicamae]MBR0752928.1 hypothetical protein [Bradyrhizobium jicamae]
MLVLDQRLIGMVEAEELSISAIDYWFDRLKQRAARAKRKPTTGPGRR